MAAVTNILYLNGGITTGIGSADTVTAPGTWTFSGTGNTVFAGNVSISGNLDVGGDIVSRGTVNLTVSDPFIDLGLGNSTTTSQAGGFTVQMAAAAGVTAASIHRFVTTTQFEINDTGATALVANQIFAITGLTGNFATNNGLYAVASVSGTAPQVVNIKSTATASAPFLQTAFTDATTTVLDIGAAFQTEISALAFANGLAFPDAGSAPYGAGLLIQNYAAAAVLADFTADAAWTPVGAGTTTLQNAYDNGNTITTNGNPIAFTLTSGNFTVEGSYAATFGYTTPLSVFSVRANGGISLNSPLSYVNINADVPPSLPLTRSINIGTNYNSTFAASEIILGNNATSHTGGFVRAIGSQAQIDVGSYANRIDIRTLDTTSPGTINIATGVAGAHNINIGTVGGPYVQSILIGNQKNGSFVALQGGLAKIAAGTDSNGTTGGPNQDVWIDAPNHSIFIGHGSGSHTIDIGDNVSGDQQITIGSTFNGYANWTKVQGSDAFIGAGLDATGSAASNTISLETQSASGTINIGAADLTHTINVGTSSTYAAAITFGSYYATGGSFKARTLGATSQANLELNGAAGDGTAVLLGGLAASVVSDNTGSATIQGGSAGTFVSGGTINVANSSSATAIYIGRTSAGAPNANTSVTIATGTGKMVQFEAVRGGVGIKAEYPVAITTGTIATIDYGVNPTSVTSAPLRLKAASASTATDRFIGVVSQASGTTPVEAGLLTVPGTFCRVTFDVATAATDVGKPVYLAGGANAGKCTLTAPSASGDNVIRVGFLTNSTAATTANTIIFYPQFIAAIP